MKKHLLMKTLLVALVCLVGGTSSVWATAVPYNVGSSTSDAWGTAFSDVWTMTGDGVVTVTFTNHCATDGDWGNNWLLLCGNAHYEPGALADGDRHFQMRSHGWEDAANSKAGFIMSDDYTTGFKTFQNGATVTLKIIRHGSTVNVNTSVTKDATTRTMTYVKTGIEGTVNFFLTQYLSYMEITAQNFSTNLAGEIMTNAFIDFSNDITGTSPYTISGAVSAMTWTGQWTVTPGLDGGMLRPANFTGIVNLVGETAGNKDIVTISFDCGLVGMSGRKNMQFIVKDVDGGTLVDEALKIFNQSWDANTLGIDVSKLVYKNGDNPGMVADTKNTFTITFNYATKRISCSVVNKNGTFGPYAIDMVDGTKAVGSLCVNADGLNKSYNFPDRRCYFDNLKITTEIGNYAAASTTYTVKYKSGGVEIKDASTGRVGDVGATPVLEASDTETFYSADGSKKYVYASDNASTTTIVDGGTTEVTVNFTTYEKRTYTLNAVDNSSNVLGELATGYVYADAPSATVDIPWYVLYGGTLYNKDGNSTSFDVESDGQTSTVEYTITDKTGVVFYSEGEDLAGVTKVANNIASKKGIARIPTETTYANLGVGSYTVYVRAHSGNTSGGTAIFKTGDVEFARKNFAGSTNNQDFNANFALLASTDLKIKYDCGNATGLDYIYVVKNSDDATIPVTVTSAGFATYVPSYDLNFSTTEIEAYKVKVSSKGVATLTKVNNVPAGTPVLLYKNGGKTENIPVMTGAAAVTENDLVAGTGAAVATTDGEYTNMILNNVSGIGFYFANGQEVAANRAYLHFATTLAPDPATARMTMIFEDDDVTGVNEVRSQKEDVRSEWFDLQGRKVAQPTKGLYIVNGKKVVLK